MNMKKIKQKLFAIGIIILGILTILPENDITAAILLIPLGLFTLFTKEQVIDF